MNVDVELVAITLNDTSVVVMHFVVDDHRGIQRTATDQAIDAEIARQSYASNVASWARITRQQYAQLRAQWTAA
jgi:hypothetical protein